MPTPTDWLAKYYPVPASEAVADDLTAIQHSVRKWEGLRAEVLLEHGLMQKEHLLMRERGFTTAFRVTGGTCALCQRYKKAPLEISCGDCPIIRLREVPCFTEYYKFTEEGNPEPMIKLLKCCEEEELKCPTK